MGIKKRTIYFFGMISFFFCIELSHRSSTFAKIIQDAERDIREILYDIFFSFILLKICFFRSIPDSYAVLFLQGGATAQFSAIPLNFLNLKPSQTADYLVTGYWSEKSANEAEKFGKINLVLPKGSKYQGKDNKKNNVLIVLHTLILQVFQLKIHGNYLKILLIFIIVLMKQFMVLKSMIYHQLYQKMSQSFVICHQIF
jgi:hypothetical protein